MRILMVTTMRDEAPFVLEWVAHHRAIGVTDFLIYSNDCSDGTDALLDALDAAGIVNHIPQTVAEGATPQWQALKAAWRHPLRKACDWALVADVDEFLNIQTDEGDIPSLIAAMPEGTDAIAILWRLFGTSGQVRFVDLPVAEQFTRCAPEQSIGVLACWYFKTLFRLDGPFNKFKVHRPGQREGATANWADCDAKTLPAAFAQTVNRPSLAGYSTARGLAEVNHYSVKSVESFMCKTARGLPSSRKKDVDLGYWVDRNHNHVENLSIQRHRDATRAETERLRALPGVAQAHRDGVAAHRAQFHKIMQNFENAVLFSRLLIAGSSAGMAPEWARLYQAHYDRMNTPGAGRSDD